LPVLPQCRFYISYTVFELPLQLVTKKFGPGKTLPIFTLLFGLFSLVMGFVKNYGQAIGVRFCESLLCGTRPPTGARAPSLLSSLTPPAFSFSSVLGIAEGAIFPGLAFYLSRFCAPNVLLESRRSPPLTQNCPPTDRKDELGFRLSCYLVCTPAAGAFGGLLASGLLKIDSIGPYRSWRYVPARSLSLLVRRR